MEPENSMPAAQAKSKSWIAVVLIVVILAVGGYFAFRAVTGGSISGVKLSDKCKYNDPDLCKFLNNTNYPSDMRVVSTSSREGKKTENTLESTGKDNIHMLTKVDGKEESNYIIIGETTYTKDYSDNKWWEYTYKPSEEDKNLDTSYEDFKGDLNGEDKTEYKKIGEEKCGKLTCLKYQIVSAGQEGSSYIWFDKKQYLLRKSQSISDNINNEDIYEYIKVAIGAPSPTKEGQPTNSAFPSSIGSSLDTAELEKQMKSLQGELNTVGDAVEDSSEEAPISEGVPLVPAPEVPSDNEISSDSSLSEPSLSE